MNTLLIGLEAHLAAANSLMDCNKALAKALENEILTL